MRSALERQARQRERRVAEPVAEREQRRHRHVEVLRRVLLVGRRAAGALVRVVERHLADRARERDRQLAARVDVAEQHVRGGVARLRPAVPGHRATAGTFSAIHGIVSGRPFTSTTTVGLPAACTARTSSTAAPAGRARCATTPRRSSPPTRRRPARPRRRCCAASHRGRDVRRRRRPRRSQPFACSDARRAAHGLADAGEDRHRVLRPCRRPAQVPITAFASSASGPITASVAEVLAQRQHAALVAQQHDRARGRACGRGARDSGVRSAGLLARGVDVRVLEEPGAHLDRRMRRTASSTTATGRAPLLHERRAGAARRGG